MKVLLVKTSSFGDVIHTLPAVADLFRVRPEIELTWMVEESFLELPVLNQKVASVIPVSIRRWRQSWLNSLPEIKAFYAKLREQKYDLVIDAQGLMKSALLAKMAKGEVHGLDRTSSKEPASRLFYDKCYSVEKNSHAIERTRSLFAQIFNYRLKDMPLQYGITLQPSTNTKPKLFLLHGTTWASKHWPEHYWRRLAILAGDSGFDVTLTYGNEIEQARAERIIKGIEGSELLSPKSITDLVKIMGSCSGLVSVDTGLGHLANAMDLPMVGLFGPTNPDLTGPLGIHSKVLVSDNLACIPCLKNQCRYMTEEGNIYPPCFENMTPEWVLESLTKLIAASRLT